MLKLKVFTGRLSNSSKLKIKIILNHYKFKKLIVGKFAVN